jgi:hypothetical protein
MFASYFTVLVLSWYLAVHPYFRVPFSLSVLVLLPITCMFRLAQFRSYDAVFCRAPLFYLVLPAYCLSSPFHLRFIYSECSTFPLSVGVPSFFFVLPLLILLLRSISTILILLLRSISAGWCNRAGRD